ncbi:Extradiol ring-cleavage dioxygenase, class III enzyme, subunit B [Jimgerdemannia flammicorona]|uniref:Extradiol ring-cleavage dioxygenase, class III enzyme, subunit B n=1 Tax=Jimgerdemannia flammicorona TaxID=994334 RepID=A0A433D9I1_9FUNG|nr:Extradiol ring-cleavage dioxygenase, class III enzyme, subunit B [Jimgerdemannia flammicorona]
MSSQFVIVPSPKKAPVFFISHGGPNLLEDNEKPGKFYEWLGKKIREEIKPKAIVIFSAHWQGTANKVYVETSEKPKLIYDFGGFPQHYYTQEWDHKGSPELATRVVDMLKKMRNNAINAGIEAEGQKRGIDHGAWVPLKRAMNSNPDIPVVQVSQFYSESMEAHVELGAALAPLRNENILIIGSGAAVHNLREFFSTMNKPTPSYVTQFDKDMTRMVTKHVGADRIAALNTLKNHASLRKCHPTIEHLVPLHIAAGAAGEDRANKELDSNTGTLGWGSFSFGFNKV